MALRLKNIVEANNLKALKMLMENGFVVIGLFEMEDSLILACERGYLDHVEYLVEKGADINYREGRPLRMASYYGKTDVVSFLIEKTSNDIKPYSKESCYDDALSKDAERGYLDIVKLLIEHGANYNDKLIVKAANLEYLREENIEVIKYLSRLDMERE